MKKYFSLLILVLLALPLFAAQTPGINGPYYFTGEVQLRGESATSMIYLDADKKIQSNNAVTPTELSYLDGVTSAIQTQFASKLNTATLSDNRLIRGDGTAAVQASGITVSDADVISGGFLSGSTNTFTDIPLSTAVTGLLPLANGGTNQDNSSVVFPASGTIPTLTSTSVFTLKDYDGGTATDTSRLTLPKAAKATLDALTRKEATLVYASDTDKVYYDDGTILNEVGSGAAGGASFVKWITNYDAESVSVGTTGWNLYADAAGTSPVDATGGTATGMTITRTTTAGEVMIGTASYELAKDAANRQGMGVSYDFTIDNESVVEGGGEVFLTFPYNVTTNYASGDVIGYVYDRDGTTVKVCQNGNSGALQKSTVRAIHQCSFFATAGNNDYRLAFHIATTNASAYDVRFELEGFTQSSPTPTAIVADLGTETWVDSWANATTSVKLSRKGQWVTAIGTTTVTGAGASNFDITISSAYAASSDYTISSSVITPIDSSVDFFDSPGSNKPGKVTLYNNSTTLRLFATNTGDYGGITSTNPHTWASGDFMYWTATWKVAGWSTGNVISSTETFNSTVKMKATGDPASAAANAPIIVPTETYDTHGCYNTTTGVCTAPKTGYYKMHGTVQSAGSAAMRIYVNNVDAGVLGFLDSNGEGTFTGSAYALAGQSIHLGTTGTFDATFVWLQIEEDPDFSTFASLKQGMLRSRYITAGETYTKNPNARILHIISWGGGGGGGGALGTAANAAAGGAGGGGECAEDWILNSSITNSVTITIGAGGTPGANTGGTGGNGGDTSFGAYVIAKGGTGGVGDASPGTSLTGQALAALGGTGGTVSAAGKKIDGGVGGIASRYSGTNAVSGQGGTAACGGGAGGYGRTGNAAGVDGKVPGGGGSGATTNSATDQAGGTGGAGAMWVEEWD